MRVLLLPSSSLLLLLPVDISFGPGEMLRNDEEFAAESYRRPRRNSVWSVWWNCANLWRNRKSFQTKAASHNERFFKLTQVNMKFCASLDILQKKNKQDKRWINEINTKESKLNATETKLCICEWRKKFFTLSLHLDILLKRQLCLNCEIPWIAVTCRTLFWKSQLPPEHRNYVSAMDSYSSNGQQTVCGSFKQWSIINDQK